MIRAKRINARKSVNSGWIGGRFRENSAKLLGPRADLQSRLKTTYRAKWALAQGFFS